MDVIQQLRDLYPTHPIVMDAADEIERLRDGRDLMGNLWAKEKAETERLRAALQKGQFLINALDDMHAKGETFTGRVSVAASELRTALHIELETQ